MRTSPPAAAKRPRPESLRRCWRRPLQDGGPCIVKIVEVGGDLSAALHVQAALQPADDRDGPADVASLRSCFVQHMPLGGGDFVQCTRHEHLNQPMGSHPRSREVTLTLAYSDSALLILDLTMGPVRFIQPALNQSIVSEIFEIASSWVVRHSLVVVILAMSVSSAPNCLR